MKKDKDNSLGSSDIPKLPDLPKQEGMPDYDQKLPSLPRYPSSSLGNKFSQNTIKDAVSGEKEDFGNYEDEDDMEDGTDEFDEDIQTMPRLPSKSLTKEMPAPQRTPLPIMSERERSPRIQPQMRISQTPKTRESKEEPVFIRIDKFEESLEIFDNIKKQISGVEKLLTKIKDTRDDEEKELEDWEAKLNEMKGQIEDVDRNIFSKLE